MLRLAIVLVLLIGLTSYAGGNQASEAFRLTNFHEHIQSIEVVPRFLEAMQRIGVERTVIVGSPESIFMYGANGFYGEAVNNLEILKIARAYPNAFIPFPTINVDAPGKLKKLEQYFEMGGRGLKLYSGSIVYHTTALDDESMTLVYEFCWKKQIPILFHVHAPHYQAELESVLRQFPGLKIICPHFCMSTIKLI